MMGMGVGGMVAHRERDAMGGWDRRQATMAVANMVEARLWGGDGERAGQDHPSAHHTTGAGVRAPVDTGTGPRPYRVDPAPVRPGRGRRRAGLDGGAGRDR